MLKALQEESSEILVEPHLARQAMKPLQRMLDFASEQQLQVKGKA
jgi:quinolinate synthase